MRSIAMKFGGMLASLALVVTAMNVNSACLLFAHQPKLPTEAKKMRKF